MVARASRRPRQGFTQTVAWLWGLAGLALGTVAFLEGFKYLRTTGSLRTDNGSEFKSEFIKSYLGDKGIKQVFSNAYTPQSNGQVEKWNGILKRLIYMNLHKNQKYDWVEDLSGWWATTMTRGSLQ